jgi:protein-S-isoprenylcysteine O-methyltransferase Ste14
MKRFPRPPALFFAFTAIMIGANWFEILLIHIPRTIRWGGAVLVVIGVCLALWGSTLFKRIPTNINTFSDPDVLVTSGPFRFSRNPMYTGMVAALTGTALLTGSLIGIAVLAAFICTATYIYIPYEEARMRHVFKERYAQYARQVRRWL